MGVNIVAVATAGFLALAWRWGRRCGTANVEKANIEHSTSNVEP
jgi:hypothetical protein